MRKDERTFLGVTAVIMVAVCCFLGFRLLYHSDENVSGQVIEVEQPVTVPDEPKVDEKTKEYVNVFFIGQNANKEEVYKAVNREYDKDIDGSKIKFAIQALISGPKEKEKANGVYTESLYKRLYQLIKTARRNTTKPVYLHINGNKVEYIGGEGIMITQPLSENSLDG